MIPLRWAAAVFALLWILPAAWAPARAAAPRRVVLAAADGRHEALAVTLKARPFGAQPLYLVPPKGVPKGAILLFPGGGPSHIEEAEKGVFRLSRNFLLRVIGRITARGFAAAVLTHPTDLEGQRIPDDFRLGDYHAKDVAAAVDFLSARGYRNTFLLGTSRGTVSIGGLGLNLADPRIKGLIFTAAMTSRSELPSLPLDRIRYPVLFVHNRFDRCSATTHFEAKRLFDQTTASPRRHFVTVEHKAKEISSTCDAMSNHGFLGVEERTADAFLDWAEGRDPPAAVR